MEVPSSVIDSVLMKSEDMPKDSVPIKGYDFSNSCLDLHSLLSSYTTTGFQATNFGQAVTEIGRMLDKKRLPVPEEALKPYLNEPGDRPVDNCTLFLGYTSNLISSGVRETIRYLVQNNMVDCLVSSAGGIEEDFIKCMGHTYVGDFKLKGSVLRNKGINRTGNLLVPNNNYCKFEEWLMPILDRMLEEQRSQNKIWTPSTIIAELGKEINNPESVYYWAYKNNIPVFCPALTDGSLGDVMYFHSFKNPGLIVDIVQDIRKINMISVKAVNTGMIILGGGVVKHHICNANLMRNGADFAVYVNTGQEFDGSDAGASPDEAISWGKIKQTAHPVKVFADATLVFPLLVAETFARHNGDNKHSPGPKRKKRHIDASETKTTSSSRSCDSYTGDTTTTVSKSCGTVSCTAKDMDSQGSTDSCDTSSKVDNVSDTKDDMNCDSNSDIKTNTDGDNSNTDGHVNEAEMHEL